MSSENSKQRKVTKQKKKKMRARMYFRLVPARTPRLKNNVIKFFNKENAKNNKSFTVTDCKISLFCNLNISK